jgi:hypothetical protein
MARHAFPHIAARINPRKPAHEKNPFSGRRRTYLKRLLKPFILIFGMALAVFAGAEEAGVSAVLSAISEGLGANDLSDMVWDGRTLWVSGSGTLNRHAGNYGNVYDWLRYKEMPGFGQGSIYALASGEGLLVASWGWMEEYQGQAVPNGDGFSVSLDNGGTWRHIDIRELFPDRADYKRPGRYTTTWDITISDGTIWASSLSGFLLKSDDFGRNWENILPKDEPLDLQNPNHHGQCVDAYGDTVWVGTFQGINASFDRGVTWKNFSWKTGEPIDLSHPMPGNFVYAVEHQRAGGKTHVWAGGSDYYGAGQYGIYHTDNNGETWSLKTKKYNAWNFAFGHNGASDPTVTDSTVFAASDSGLAVSHDLGNTWSIMDIRESDHLKWSRGERIAAVAVVGDTLWATSSNGIARTSDWGKTWRIFKGVTRVSTLDAGHTNVGISAELDGVETYAYPNPFSPSRRDADYSRTRIHYALTGDARVTVTVYGYNGRKLRQVIGDTPRTGGRDYDEEWDGRDENGSVVPNGVYFYMIKTDKGDTARGKIVVLD